jgi:hypothetical protein
MVKAGGIWAWVSWTFWSDVAPVVTVISGLLAAIFTGLQIFDFLQRKNSKRKPP